MASHVVWINADINKEENTKYVKELQSINSLQLELFKDVEDAINHLKKLIPRKLN